jgi:CDP-diacylglycerol--serine O-phosphatidyltransferase
MPEYPVKPFHKGVYLLPNLMTSASLFSGFLGLVWAASGRFEACAVAILASAFFDGLDGKVARLTKTVSPFGVQFDSLADLVAFGVTPAAMAYFWRLHEFGRLGVAVGFLYVVCGALRLARFNVQFPGSSKKYFVGLPIPAAGCLLSTLVLFSPFMPEVFKSAGLSWFVLVLAVLLGYLMVSRVRYASFKEYGFARAHSFSLMVAAVLLFVLVASHPRVLGFLLLFAYLISGPINTYFFMLRRRRAPQEKSEEKPNEA